MAIQRDLSHLPEPSKDPGMRPSPPEIMSLVLAERKARTISERTREMAYLDARIRHSWAGHCSRRLGYEISGTEESDVPSEASYWSFAVGNAVHSLWQNDVEPALRAAGWTDIEVERKARVESDGMVTAAHLDLSAVDPDGLLVAFELKSINGYGFKVLVGAAGDRPGPRHNDMLQGAVNADAIGADRLILLYASLESISESIAKRSGLDEYARFSAQFDFAQAQFLPLALRERGRWQEVVGAIDSGTLPVRMIPDPEIPDGALITDPTTGRWEIHTDGYVTGSGRTWHCTYCPYQTLCPTDA